MSAAALPSHRHPSPPPSPHHHSPSDEDEEYLALGTHVLYSGGPRANLSAEDVVEYLRHIFLSLYINYYRLITS